MNSSPAPPSQRISAIIIQSSEASAPKVLLWAGTAAARSEPTAVVTKVATGSTSAGASSVSVGMNRRATGNIQSR